ncbi:hypothetical protein [Myxacorys almedinensis]|uniref:Uncharacterized protein n=1 Tax=Myxacorys almedinensis A TaxID=2690445 RepID=A0A8J7Z8E4_9CYAN|nr:hypothetical protein [Myxacorys almedinensis]NDJ19943.1 hypothetical protein [Myxacorys almedinensis A]
MPSDWLIFMSQILELLRGEHPVFIPLLIESINRFAKNEDSYQSIKTDTVRYVTNKTKYNLGMDVSGMAESIRRN